MSGLTSTGFEIKTQSVIQTEIEEALRALFGNSINTTPPSVFGQLIGIVSEREALIWELAQNIYNNQYPDTAQGTSLVNICRITGTIPYGATSSIGNGLCIGTVGTLIPALTTFSVYGDPLSKFRTTIDATITAAQNSIQQIILSDIPDAGTFTITFDGQTTTPIAYNANNAAIKAALEALTNIDSVTVSGAGSVTITVEFTGTDGLLDKPRMSITSSLTISARAITASVVDSQYGGANVLVPIQAESTGPTQALANTLTVIETPISGLSSIRNPDDVTVGRDAETDSELRLRRDTELYSSRGGTVESIKTKIAALPGVTIAKVFENITDVTDGDGLPPHSIQSVLQGGDDQTIADKIWEVKPAGIQTYGSTTETVIDSEGISHSISFSRPTLIDIYLDLTLTTDSNFPIDGNTQIETAILAFGNTLAMGDDVIVYPKLMATVNNIPGILDMVIKIGIAPSPTLDDNIIIAPREWASFSSSRIVIH